MAFTYSLANSKAIPWNMPFHAAFHPKVIGQSVGRAVHYGIILCENRATCWYKDMGYLLALNPLNHLQAPISDSSPLVCYSW